MKRAESSSKKGERSIVQRRENVVFTSLFTLVFFLLLVPFSFFIIAHPPKLNDALTGNAASLMAILNAAPVINLTNETYVTQTFINISICGYDPNVDPINCTFSAPFDYYNGTWFPGELDDGNYEIQINATDGLLTTTKNITIFVVPANVYGACDMKFDILPDQNLNITWSNSLKKNSLENQTYTNFTLSYTDEPWNGTFNLTDAINISGITTPYYYDTWANMTVQRYYKLFAFKGLQQFECNTTYGKFTHDLTANYGRWNYLSSPFKITNRSIKYVFRSAWDNLENLFIYNHTSGSFNFFLFNVPPDGFGDFSEIPDGVCLLVQPLGISGAKVTFTGEVLTELNQDLTMNYGRWNYQGSVAADISRKDAFKGYEFDLENLFKYNHSTGSFRFFIFSINPPTGFGEINDIPAGSCNLIQPLNPVNYNISI